MRFYSRKNITRPPKPKDRSAIIRWYKQSELPIGTGLDPATGEPAPWFHGILARQEADALLSNQPPGAFLVRVSERIFGYTISVGDENGSLKHFLVEIHDGGYQFLGTNQIVHESLAKLVDYHEVCFYFSWCLNLLKTSNTSDAFNYAYTFQARPITSKGRELLLYPIGQTNSAIPDYADLFDSQARATPLTATYRRHVRDGRH